MSTEPKPTEPMSQEMKQAQPARLRLLAVGVLVTVAVAMCVFLTLNQLTARPGSGAAQSGKAPARAGQQMAGVHGNTSGGQPYIVRAGRSPIPAEGEAIAHVLPVVELMKHDAPAHPIPYAQAPRFLNQTVTVEGVIREASVVSDGKLNLLYFGKSDDQSFYLAMFSDAFPAVTGVPAEVLINQSVRVTGPVTLFNGRPQIKVTDPAQLTVLPAKASKTLGTLQAAADAPEAAPDAPETPNAPEAPEVAPDAPQQVAPDTAPAESAGPALPEGVIPWTAARQHVGELVTVQGRIVNARNFNEVTFLNFDQDWQDKFYIFITKQARTDAEQGSGADVGPSDPASFYLNKIIRVTGKIEMHDSDKPGIPARPQIKVFKFNQIVVVPESE